LGPRAGRSGDKFLALPGIETRLLGFPAGSLVTNPGCLYNPLHIKSLGSVISYRDLAAAHRVTLTSEVCRRQPQDLIYHTIMRKISDNDRQGEMVSWKQIPT
jgi:hypothetical protein